MEILGSDLYSPSPSLPTVPTTQSHYDGEKFPWKGQPPPQPVYHNQQPTATQPMSTGGGGNRNAKNKPMNLKGGRRAWSNGICSHCSDWGTFCTAWWCPCVVYGRNKQRLEHLNRTGYPDPSHGGCVNPDCLIHAVLTSCLGFGWILQIPLRGSIRARYNIAGGSCGDFCSSFWCGPCELTQGSQEIQLEEQSFQVAQPRR